MKLDFLEIGTSNFRTLIQEAGNDAVGISIEPLQEYLDQLPNKRGVIKENCAISFDDTEGDINIYYIPESVIDKHRLPRWVKGCNKLNEYHPKHVELKIEHLVKVQTVKQIPISKLFEKYDIESVKLLKIDTEGGDCDILLNLREYLIDKDRSMLPKQIIFETNFLTPEDKINRVIDLYTKLGYRVAKRKLPDTVLILQ